LASSAAVSTVSLFIHLVCHFAFAVIGVSAQPLSAVRSTPSPSVDGVAAHVVDAS
jgi:hypothetical protein